MASAGKSAELGQFRVVTVEQEDGNSSPPRAPTPPDVGDAGAQPSVRLSTPRGHRRNVRPDIDISQHRLRRRMTRAGTVHIVDPVLDRLDDRPGWHPGAEPGIDTSRPDGGHASMINLRATCQITIVDFSENEIDIHELNNDEMIVFLKLPRPDWVKCRWINVNALSWDVIQALGQYKQLHSLAIEDLMNTQNRTKADWYGYLLPAASHAPEKEHMLTACPTGTQTMHS